MFKILLGRAKMKPVNKKQCIETGLAMSLIAVLAGLITGRHIYQLIALCLIAMDLLLPSAFYPLAVVWFCISEVMGSIASKILLGLIFFIIVTPVGLFRRLTGKDRLNLSGFRRDKKSIFKVRNHICTAQDLENTY